MGGGGSSELENLHKRRLEIDPSGLLLQQDWATYAAAFDTHFGLMWSHTGLFGSNERNEGDYAQMVFNGSACLVFDLPWNIFCLFHSNVGKTAEQASVLKRLAWHHRSEPLGPLTILLAYIVIDSNLSLSWCPHLVDILKALHVILFTNCSRFTTWNIMWNMQKCIWITRALQMYTRTLWPFSLEIHGWEV